MSKLRSIIIYSFGDSRRLSTWSNVPFLFCKALERRGVTLHRVNIEANQTVRRVYDSFFYRLFRKVFRSNASPEFERSPFHRWMVNRRLRKATRMYPNAELNLFLSYFTANKYSDKPSVLWCDWTDRVCIERMGREPKTYEKWALAQEDKAVKGADVVYTMFPKCKEHMEGLYGREFRYLSRNVVNTVYEKPYKIDELILNRFHSDAILFIGNHRYAGAARELINSFGDLKKRRPNISLHIIGMTKKELAINAVESDIHCYGYLNKDVDEERDLYYDLLLRAKLFVNPASQWGGYSSTIEAMFYGCPIIVSPYADFVEEFGNKIDFGIYHKANQLTAELNELLSLSEKDYSSMATAAANRVKDYTWDKYVDAFLLDIEQMIK